jgi:predicted anti-sigma-YlaC factor YlaD
VAAALVLAMASGCSVRNYALGQLGDALAASRTTFGSDEDPELIRAAAPFSLKLMESVLAGLPEHAGLLAAAASGFTQYAYAFVQQEADEREAEDVAAARALRARARALYLRGRDYGLRALEVRHAGFAAQIAGEPHRALSRLEPADTGCVYWTTVAWAAAIALSKDSAQALADLRTVDAMVARLAALDPDLEDGALHAFLITYETGKPGARDAEARARKHFEHAVRLSSARRAGPYVALAESVSVAAQDKREFAALLGRALAIDVAARPEWRLENTVMQRRARWLLARTEQLFLE